jgi:hypothetical protein
MPPPAAADCCAGSLCWPTALDPLRSHWHERSKQRLQVVVVMVVVVRGGGGGHTALGRKDGDASLALDGKV